MVASHHVPNIGNAITPLTMGPIGTTLAMDGRVQATPLLQNRFLGIYLVVTANHTVNVLVLWGVQIKKHPQFS